jgi:hypothetical protein
MNDQNTRMSPIDFATLGAQTLAYIREMSADETDEIATQTGLPIKGVKLYGLYSADGRRMAVTDSIETARASALDHDLVTVSVH